MVIKERVVLIGIMNNLTVLLPALQSALRSVNFYGSICVLVPGLFLNVFTFFFFFLRKKFWHNNLKMGFFYSLDCFFSICAVSIGIVSFLPASLGYDISTKSSTWCQLIWLARYQCVQSGGWFSTLITLERTVTVINRRSIFVLSKYKYLFVMTVIICIFVAVTNILNWWRYVEIILQVRGNTTVKTFICTGSNEIIIATTIIAMINRFSPPLINFIMNILIIRILVKSKNRVRGNQTGKILSQREYNFAFSLLANNFIYVFLAIPSSVLMSILIRNMFVPVTAQWNSFITILFNIAAWGHYIYVSMPFFYNLAFNKIFRTELFDWAFKHSSSRLELTSHTY